MIDFWLARVPEGDVNVDVLDKAGAVIRRFSTRKPDPAAPVSLDAPASTLTVKAGLNRMVWNVRHDHAVPLPGLYVFGTIQGRQVLPGYYQLLLTAGERTLTEPLTVKMDPRVTTPLAELQAQDDLVVRVDEELAIAERARVRRKSNMASRRVRRGLPPEPTEQERNRRREEDDDMDGPDMGFRGGDR